MPALNIRTAEALIGIGWPREALTEALAALERFTERKALAGATHIEEARYLVERFGSPHQLLETYAALVTMQGDRQLNATVTEMRHLLLERSNEVRRFLFRETNGLVSVLPPSLLFKRKVEIGRYESSGSPRAAASLRSALEGLRATTLGISR